jgi:hypothetical protein
MTAVAQWVVVAVLVGCGGGSPPPASSGESGTGTSGGGTSGRTVDAITEDEAAMQSARTFAFRQEGVAADDDMGVDGPAAIELFQASIAEELTARGYQPADSGADLVVDFAVDGVVDASAISEDGAVAEGATTDGTIVIVVRRGADLGEVWRARLHNPEVQPGSVDAAVVRRAIHEMFERWPGHAPAGGEGA